MHCAKATCRTMRHAHMPDHAWRRLHGLPVAASEADDSCLGSAGYFDKSTIGYWVPMKVINIWPFHVSFGSGQRFKRRIRHSSINYKAWLQTDFWLQRFSKKSQSQDIRSCRCCSDGLLAGHQERLQLLLQLLGKVL